MRRGFVINGLWFVQLVIHLLILSYDKPVDIEFDSAQPTPIGRIVTAVIITLSKLREGDIWEIFIEFGDLRFIINNFGNVVALIPYYYVTLFCILISNVLCYIIPNLLVVDNILARIRHGKVTSQLAKTAA